MNKLFLIFLIGLFSISTFSATKTWNGNGADNNWQTAANWVGGVAPVANDDLVFPAAAAQFTTNNNLFLLTNFNSITIQGGNYTITGNLFRLSNGLTVSGGIQTINTAISLNGNQTFNIADITSVVTVAAITFGNFNLTIDGNGVLVMGLVSGGGNITKNGAGIGYIVTATGYNGNINLFNGIFIVDANLPNTRVVVLAQNTGGTQFGLNGFGGNGTVGTVEVISGGVSAGSLANPTGILTINNTLLLTGNAGAVVVKIGGTTAGNNGYDQFNVLGNVTLNSALLIPLPFNNFRPMIGDSFKIINNAGPNPVNGTFFNLPEGAILAGALNTAFRITYQGGDGNDVVITRVSKAKFDFDGDGKTDISVFRNGNWYKNLSSNGNFEATAFGLPTDKITPADFDGDNRADVAVYRPSNGTWYILRSSDSTFSAVQFGAAEDIPVPNDFDGDGRADFTVFRPSNGTWYQLRSLDNSFFGQQFGTNGDKPQAGDFDGDGIGDLAVFRPSNGAWYSLNSADGSFSAAQFGLSADTPVPADYDGDGKTDLAVFRDGLTAGNQANFYVLRSSDSGFQSAPFGTFGDIPVVGDYDGDGRADYAVFRPSLGNWYLLGTTAGFSGVTFGQNGDKPIPSAFLQ